MRNNSLFSKLLIGFTSLVITTGVLTPAPARAGFDEDDALRIIQIIIESELQDDDKYDKHDDYNDVEDAVSDLGDYYYDLDHKEQKIARVLIHCFYYYNGCSESRLTNSEFYYDLSKDRRKDAKKIRNKIAKIANGLSSSYRDDFYKKSYNRYASGYQYEHHSDTGLKDAVDEFEDYYDDLGKKRRNIVKLITRCFKNNHGCSEQRLRTSDFYRNLGERRQQFARNARFKIEQLGKQVDYDYRYDFYDEIYDHAWD